MMAGKRYAVLIGNSKYPNDARLQPLRCPEKDVDELEKVLKSKEYGNFTDVAVLKDAPHYESEDKLLGILNAARKDDLVLIYYSGHGKLGREGGLHLAALNTNIDRLEATSIAADRIRVFLKSSSTRKVILILDCCYSGRVGEAFLKGGVEDQLAQIQNTGQGIYILTASSGLEVAQEKPEDEYSLLTKHILEGIKQGKADFDDKGTVSIADLYRYSWEQMKKADFQAPMKWECSVQGDELVVAHTGKVSGEKRRDQIAQVLYDFGKENSLPRPILKKALEILDTGRDQLSEDQIGFNSLLDRLVQNHLNAIEFALEWRVLDRGIEDALKRKQVKSLYHEAKKARSVEDWAAVLDISKQLLALDPTYADVPDIAEEAQKRVESVNLLESGKEHHRQNRWAEAIAALKQVPSDSKVYQEARSLIATAEEDQADELAAAKQKARIDAFYREAEDMISDQKWVAANQKLAAILKIDPTNELAAKKLIEVEQSQLAALYDKGRKFYDAAQYQDALDCFQSVAEIDEDYRDLRILRHNAEATVRLKREAEEAAAWRAKQELERLEEEARARRKAETAARKAVELEAERLRKEEEQIARRLAETERVRREQEEEERKATEAAALARAIEEKKRAEERTTQRLEPQAETTFAVGQPISRRYGSDADLPVEVSDEEKQFHNDARRFARLLTSEIRLYNEEKVREGRAQSDLYQRLREYIDRSREMYDKRVNPKVARLYDYFHHELVNTLAEGDEAKLGDNYPGAVRLGKMVTAKLTPVVSDKKVSEYRAKITHSRGAAFAVLVIGVLFLSAGAATLYFSNFTSLLSAFLYLVVVGVLALAGLSLLVFGLALLVVSGEAFCPICITKLEGIKSSNDAVLCKGCGTYLEGKDDWLWPTDENRIADKPVFGCQLISETPIFPKRCCVCGEEAVRGATVELSRRSGSHTSFSIASNFNFLTVPHCAEHMDGVVFEEKQGKPYLKFRSHAYWKEFSQINQTIPGTA